MLSSVSSAMCLCLSRPAGLGPRGHVDVALLRDGEGARELALRGLEARGVLQLARCVLHPQAEQVAPRRRDVVAQRVVVQLVQLTGSHACSRSSRRTNFVFTGSLWPASRMASRASGSGTPASSNITRPGFTTATQPSGEPLPEPMRVSAGFFVKGLSG